MRVIGLAAIALVLAGALIGGFSVSLEAAAIKISVPARYIEATASAHGAPAGGQFATRRLEVQLTESVQGSATGVARTAATYASGYVVFTHSCAAIPTCPGAPAQPGYEVCSVNPAGGAWCYVLQATVSCYCGEHVPVRARGPGSTFNKGPHTVTTLGWGDPWVSVDNPAPISGGSDAYSSPIVQQSDLDAVRASLSAQVTDELNAAIQTKAQNLHYLADNSPSLSVSSDLAAGAHSSSFQVTISGSLGATAFADSDAMASLGKSLSAKVPPGYRLGAPPGLIDYRVADFNARGDVTVTADAVGLLLREISAQSLRPRLRGMTPGAAATVIQGLAPGSSIDIRLSPIAAPLLPLNPDRISIEILTARS